MFMLILSLPQMHLITLLVLLIRFFWQMPVQLLDVTHFELMVLVKSFSFSSTI